METQQGKGQYTGSKMLTGMENTVLRHPWDETQHRAGASSPPWSLQPPPAGTGCAVGTYTS